MPSQKRARQRERRSARVAIEQAQQRRRRGYRRVAGMVVVAGVIVGLIALLSGGKKPVTPPVAVTTTTLTKVAVKPVCPPVGGAAKRITQFTTPPPVCISRTGVYDATFKTDVGTFVVQMDAADDVPAVNNFVFLARYRYYDGLYFQRVVPGFVVQGGDPTEKGGGLPGYTWSGKVPNKSCEAKQTCYATGEIAWANQGSPSTNGAQYFIVLPGGGAQLSAVYTEFGKVISGMSVVERIGQDGTSGGTPTVRHTVSTVTITQVSS